MPAEESGADAGEDEAMPAEEEEADPNNPFN